MSAGLPGFGLGGIFFIASALFAVPRELWRTAQGRSSAAAWLTVGRQSAQAAAMVAVVVLAIRAPLLPIAVGVAALALLLATAKLAALFVARPRAALRSRTRVRRDRRAAEPVSAEGGSRS